MQTRKIIFTVSIIFVAIVTLLGTAFISIRLFLNQFIDDNYHRRTAVWQETSDSIPDGGIVFIGDSHTEYFMVDEFFPGYPVINRGIFGDTTYGVKKRLNESVFKLNPAKVFLFIGVNDTKKTNDSNETIAENIREIVFSIKNSNQETVIYLQSLYPVNQSRFDPYKISNNRISEINLLLKSLCDDVNILYIDMFSHLVDEYGQLRKEYTVDGLHLNAAGYRYVANILHQYINGNIL
ncbi:MAG: GDSL-type esterase/lipase family protein [Treponema sp.]|jgi:lysophospholipase L1-like esterase|nr:GDSL-type esterase/lipase family protein [Treponema sp.]